MSAPSKRVLGVFVARPLIAIVIAAIVVGASALAPAYDARDRP
jgi:hypothetical protein